MNKRFDPANRMRAASGVPHFEKACFPAWTRVRSMPVILNRRVP